MKRRELFRYSYLFYCFIRVFNRVHVGSQGIIVSPGFIHRSISIFSLTIVCNTLFLKYMITGDYVGDAFWSIFIFILGFDLYYFYKVKTYEEIIELYKNTPDKLALMIGRIYLFATFFLLLAWWYLYPEVHW